MLNSPINTEDDRIDIQMKEEPKQSKSFKCEKCGHIFTFAWNLRQHQKHSKICGTSDEEFKCSNCGKKFTLNATLKQHFARCIAVDPHRFECKYCMRKFTFKSSLRKHMRARCPNLGINQELNKKDDEDFPPLEEVNIHDIDFKTIEIILKEEPIETDTEDEFQAVK